VEETATVTSQQQTHKHTKEYTPSTHTHMQPLYSHYTRQLVLAGTHSSEPENFVRRFTAQWHIQDEVGGDWSFKFILKPEKTLLANMTRWKMCTMCITATAGRISTIHQICVP